MMARTITTSKLSRKRTTKAGTEKYRFAGASLGAATVTQARRLVHAVAHLDPLYVPVDLRTRHVGKPWMASFVLFIIAAPLANLARGVWHGMGEPERRRQQECAKHGLLGGKASTSAQRAATESSGKRPDSGAVNLLADTGSQRAEYPLTQESKGS